MANVFTIIIENGIHRKLPYHTQLYVHKTKLGRRTGVISVSQQNRNVKYFRCYDLSCIMTECVLLAEMFD